MSEDTKVGFILRAVDRTKTAVQSAGTRLQSLGPIARRAGAAIGRGLVGGLGAARRGITNLVRSMAAKIRSVTVLFMGLALGGAGAVFVITKAIRAWEEKSKSLTGVLRGLELTGQATKENVKYLASLSDHLQDAANVSDDVADGMISMSLAAGKSVSEIGDLVTGAVAFSRMAKRMGRDLSPLMAMQQILRARMDGGKGAMAMMGREMVSTGDKAKDYAKFLKMLNDAYAGGIARVDDFGAKMESARLKISDFIKQIGRNIVVGTKLEGVVDSIRGALDRLISFLSKDDNPFQRWLADVKEVAIRVAGLIKVMSTAEGRKSIKEPLKKVSSAIGNDLTLVFIVAAHGFVAVLLKAMPIIGRVLGGATLSMLKNVGRETRDRVQASKDLGIGTKAMPWRYDKEGMAQQQSMIDKRVASIQEERHSESMRKMGLSPEDIESRVKEMSGGKKGFKLADALRGLLGEEPVLQGADDVEEAMRDAAKHGTRTHKAPTAPGQQGAAGTGVMPQLRQVSSFVKAMKEFGDNLAGKARARQAGRSESGFQQFLGHAQALGATVRETPPQLELMEKQTGFLETIASNTQKMAASDGDEQE